MTGPPAEGGSYSDTDDPEVLDARMRLDFVDWWRPAAVERPWVSLRTLRGGEPFRAWWELGTKWDPECGQAPVIEVAGHSPDDGPRIDLPETVDTVGWWILSRVDVETARRWVEAGITNPFESREWANTLGQYLPGRLGCRRLAISRRGWWSPTTEGWELLAVLLDARVDRATLAAPECQGYLRRRFPEILDRLTG